MTLQSEDMGKLVAGPLTADMVPLLTEQSVLTKCAGGAIVRFEGYHLNEVWKRPDVIAGAEIVPYYALKYLGEITEDGWIEGEWAVNPVPGAWVEYWTDADRYGSDRAGNLRWAKIKRFRPAHSEFDWTAATEQAWADNNPAAHSEAQPETDGGGEALSNMDRVREFHETFGVPVLASPCIPADRVKLRLDILDEERCELSEALEAGDVVEVADALTDMAYLIYGTALEFGIDLNACFAEVHRSNMSKLGADGKPIYREDGKVMKGPNYSPPDLSAALASKGV